SRSLAEGAGVKRSFNLSKDAANPVAVHQSAPVLNSPTGIQKIRPDTFAAVVITASTIGALGPAIPARSVEKLSTAGPIVFTRKTPRSMFAGTVMRNSQAGSRPKPAVAPHATEKYR
ncbi:MAG: hypothetical protein ACE5JU_24550, partial [Candidatus Binatia bacterium]